MIEYTWVTCYAQHESGYKMLHNCVAAQQPHKQQQDRQKISKMLFKWWNVPKSVLCDRLSSPVAGLKFLPWYGISLEGIRNTYVRQRQSQTGIHIDRQYRQTDRQELRHRQRQRAAYKRACNTKAVIRDTFWREKSDCLTYKLEALWNDHAQTDVNVHQIWSNSLETCRSY